MKTIAYVYIIAADILFLISSIEIDKLSLWELFIIILKLTVNKQLTPRML